jgi:hemolysin D
LRQKKIRQNSDVRILERETERARGEMVQLQELRNLKVATQVETDAARLKYMELRDKLVQARLPVDEEPVEICRRALRVLEKQYAGKRRDLTLKKSSKEKEVGEAQKDLESLRLERAHAEIRAPVSGVITRGDVKVGTLVQPQQVIVEIAEQKGFLFEADVPNEEVGQVQVGLPARIKLDPYDFQKYGILEGKVSFISPDSDVGEKSRAASYRVRIELAADEVHRGENQGPVKLGMTGQADIVIDQERLLVLLVRKINRSISLR